MTVHIAQAREMGARLVFCTRPADPSISDQTLEAGLDAAWLVVGNDYELELVHNRTGRSVADLAKTSIVALTQGARAASSTSVAKSWRSRRSHRGASWTPPGRATPTSPACSPGCVAVWTRRRQAAWGTRRHLRGGAAGAPGSSLHPAEFVARYGEVFGAEPVVAASASTARRTSA